MKKTKLVALSLALVMLLTACGGGANNGANGDKNSGAGENNQASAPAPADKDELVVAMQEEPTSLDPVEQSALYAEYLLKQIFNTLVVRTPDGDMEYVLAEKIEQPDELSYEITLKDGVKFSNGDPLTSEDVKFTLERAAESDNYSYIYDKIDADSYDTTDPLVLKFKLKEADSSFEAALSHPAVSIVSKNFVEGAKDGISEAPVGTGPFKLDKWDKLNTLELSYNENYWGDEPAFHKMTFRIIPEANNRTIELESGQVDIALEVAPNDIEKIEGNDALTVHRVVDNSIHYAGFNTAKAPYDNAKVRQALAHAIDLQAIVDAVYMGVGQQATGPINPNFDYSIADTLEAPKYDPELAKEMLAEAGVKEGTPLKIYTTQAQDRKDMATIMQSQLAEVGISVEITSLEWGAFVNALENNEHDMFLMSWTPSIVDPHYTLYTPYHSANEGVPPNFTHYNSAEIDQLIDKGVKLPAGEERAEVYKQIQEKMVEDAPSLFILYGEQVVGTQSYVKNFQPDPSGSSIFYNVTFE